MVTFGSGEHKVVALHGWFGTGEDWVGLPWDGASFSYAFPDYRGYGSRRTATGEYSLAEISADVRALADDLGWQRFSLIGHSMGGAAALRVLADAPERVRSIVGVAPIPASGFPFDEAGWQLFTSAVSDPQKRRVIIDFTTGSRNTGVWLDAMVAGSVAGSTTEAFGGYLPAWGRADFASQVAGTPVPIKVIVGEHDPAVGADLAAKTWKVDFPDAEVVVMPNAGHYPMHETPVQLVTQIEAFLAQL